MNRYRLVGAVVACAAAAATLALVAGSSGDASAQTGPAAQSANIAGTLTIEGLEGASSLALRSYSWGVQNPITIGTPGGGSGSGKPTFSDLSVTRLLDDVSPRFVRAVATGEHFDTATLEVPTGKGTMQYTLETVFVTSVQHSAGGGDAVEVLSLTYGSVQVESLP